MYLIGLTGGIAAGKSTVARRFVEHGAKHIDADDIAREVVVVGSVGLAQIFEAFGDKFRTASGELDRRALAEVIFDDATKRTRLEEILHPLIRQRTQDLLGEFGSEDIVVYNVPLLVEAKVDHDFDLVVTVEAPEEEQVKRLISGRGLSATEAKSRIAAQAKPVERAARANRILNSNQDQSALMRDADKLWREIQELASLKRQA